MFPLPSKKKLTMLLYCVALLFTEQHAVDELLQWAVKGADIDGQVLAYLELAQVIFI